MAPNKPPSSSWWRWHGRGGQASWALPQQTLVSNTKARPEYTDILRHEYQDAPDVLTQKVDVLASLLLRSQHAVIYAGAGLSVASGLDDYASERGETAAQERGFGALAQPNVGHAIVAQLVASGLVCHVVNQNHDALLHKAGVPPQMVNEIHGSWFDPSNPGGNELRDDLYQRLLQTEQSLDLCWAMGTSLSGLNADRLATTAATRNGGGLVILNLQQTPLDEQCHLRLFGNIETVLQQLAQRLALPVPTAPVAAAAAPLTYFYRVPYHPVTGHRSSDAATTLSLAVGASVTIVQGAFAGCRATVVALHRYGWELEIVQTLSMDDDESAEAVTITERHLLGRWWLEAARWGQIDRLPVVPAASSP